MKKFLLMGSVLLCSTLTLAATPDIKPQIAPKVTPSSADTKNIATADTISRNIDRRLMYFNKYKKANDIESISKLISEENKDFSTNFIKYVKDSSEFTLKRNSDEKIIKTPNGEYIFPAIMTLDGKENKISLTFIEETSDTGSKWLIWDSNMHIQVPLSKKNNGLSSSVIGKTQTPKTTPPSKIVSGEVPSVSLMSAETQTKEPNQQNLESSAIKTDPVITKPAPEGTKPPSEQGPNILIIGGISLLCLLIIVGAIFIIINKRKKVALITTAPLTTPTTTPSIHQTTPTIQPTPQQSIPQTPRPSQVSNVSISTVETIHQTSEQANTPIPPHRDNATPIITAAAPTAQNTPSPLPTQSPVAPIPAAPTAQNITPSPVSEKTLDTPSPLPTQSPVAPIPATPTINTTVTHLDGSKTVPIENNQTQGPVGIPPNSTNKALPSSPTNILLGTPENTSQTQGIHEQGLSAEEKSIIDTIKNTPSSQEGASLAPEKTGSISMTQPVISPSSLFAPETTTQENISSQNSPQIVQKEEIPHAISPLFENMFSSETTQPTSGTTQAPKPLS